MIFCICTRDETADASTVIIVYRLTKNPFKIDRNANPIFFIIIHFAYFYAHNLFHHFKLNDYINIFNRIANEMIK